MRIQSTDDFNTMNKLYKVTVGFEEVATLGPRELELVRSFSKCGVTGQLLALAVIAWSVERKINENQIRPD